ncbi:MAG: hypothetical protein ABIJ56_15500 [Pseudomonadota bacterium]
MGIIRIALIAFLVSAAAAGCGSGSGPADLDADGGGTDAISDTDGSGDPLPDLVTDDGMDVPPDPFDDPLPDAPGDGSEETALPPVDCTAIAEHEDWELCESTADTCSGVFYDGAGCVDLCEAAGLVCGRVFENGEESCVKDTSRPELACDPPTDHGSDWCDCVREECDPDCGGRECGPDGCGGLCGGECPEGWTCRDGTCVEGGPDCSTYPFGADDLYAERVGFGGNVTGGDPDNVYIVTTLANDGEGSLRRALESDEDYWVGFEVEGRIVLADGDTAERLYVRSNKTVDGRGRDITIEGNLIIDEQRNIIITDVRLTNDLEGHCEQDGDVVTITGTGGATPESYPARDIWANHLELFNGGDGLFDIRGGSNITFSWNHLHTHKEAILAWETSDNEPAPGMRVTFHHNFFDQVTLRGPQFLYGWAHYYNNYQFKWYEYGAGCFGEGQMYSENNVYEAIPGVVYTYADPNPCGDDDRLRPVRKAGLVTEWADHSRGYTSSVGDVLLNDATVDVNEPGRVFNPSDHYTYTADPANAAMAARVMEESGPRVDYCR